jgi:hypothetical protein
LNAKQDTLASAVAEVAPYPVILTDAGAPTVLANAPLAVTRAHAGAAAAAVLAEATQTVVLAAPPHSLHWLLMRWCGHMPAPPHSLHVLLRHWCSQMLAPPHSLHWLLWRLCGQTLCGSFIFAAPAEAASASSRLRRLRVLLLPTRAASSDTTRGVLSPSSSSPPAVLPASPRPTTPSSMPDLFCYTSQFVPQDCNRFQRPQGSGSQRLVCRIPCSGQAQMMMMSFICSCRNKNERKAIYRKGTSHHTSLFRAPSTNDMKK